MIFLKEKYKTLLDSIDSLFNLDKETLDDLFIVENKFDIELLIHKILENNINKDYPNIKTILKNEYDKYKVTLFKIYNKNLNEIKNSNNENLVVFVEIDTGDIVDKTISLLKVKDKFNKDFINFINKKQNVVDLKRCVSKRFSSQMHVLNINVKHDIRDLKNAVLKIQEIFNYTKDEIKKMYKTQTRSKPIARLYKVLDSITDSEKEAIHEVILHKYPFLLTKEDYDGKYFNELLGMAKSLIKYYGAEIYIDSDFIKTIPEKLKVFFIKDIPDILIPIYSRMLTEEDYACFIDEMAFDKNMKLRSEAATSVIATIDRYIEKSFTYGYHNRLLESKENREWIVKRRKYLQQNIICVDYDKTVTCPVSLQDKFLNMTPEEVFEYFLDKKYSNSSCNIEEKLNIKSEFYKNLYYIVKNNKKDDDKKCSDEKISMFINEEIKKLQQQ